MFEKMLCSGYASPEEKREARRVQWSALATGLVMVIIIAILSGIMKEVFHDSSAAFNVFFSALIMLVAMTYTYVTYLVRLQIKQEIRRQKAEGQK
ncbi:MAG: hypothetical protein EHM61_24425 [Acidobacteria bacterium]|nr:MAG: hypothetical protein EHM61_24425 [Acidobacteriota bacterium]